MDSLQTIIQDNSGGLSSIRIGFLVSLGIVLATWLFVCVVRKEIVSIPEPVVTLVLGVSAAKCVQRFGEKSEN